MGKLRGWIADLFQVEDENKVARTVFDKDGYLYQRSTKITALGTDLNKATLLASADRVNKIAKVALAIASTNVLSWANPEASSIIVNKVIVDITTASTGASTIDIGTTATSATTSSDNLIDGVSGAAIAAVDNANSAGTNGKSLQKLAAGKWVTGTQASGNITGIVGYAYIHYTVI